MTVNNKTVKSQVQESSVLRACASVWYFLDFPGGCQNTSNE